MIMKHIKLTVLFSFAILIGFAQTSFAQKYGSFEKGRAKNMLKVVIKNVEDKYYDPNFKGIDLKAKEKEAMEKINNSESQGQAFGIIAQVLLDLNDSHTFFIPPERPAKIEYGWKIQVIGDDTYVYAVKPKSDAHKKGLKTGDKVLTVNGFLPTKQDLWKMNYYYYSINPQTKMKLEIQSPGEKPREIIIDTKVVQTKPIINLDNDFDINNYLRELSDDGKSEAHRFIKREGVIVWNMPSFSYDTKQVREIMDKYVEGTSGLILDLRGNGGGYVKTLEELAGFMFDKDVKIAETKSRKKTEEMLAVTKGSKVYKGKIVVLVDSNSGSASEIFARLIQIHERGKVLGDISAGAVMQSINQANTLGNATGGQAVYGTSITISDVIMTDGKSLENIGVIPDEKILITGEDLAYERDPVLARALEMLGVEISSDKAGKLFPFHWADGKEGNVTAVNP